MRKVVGWLKGEVAKERALEGEIATTYTEKDESDAPSGHMPLPGTDCEVVAYPVNESNSRSVRVPDHPRWCPPHQSRPSASQLPHDRAAHRPRRATGADERDDRQMFEKK